MSRYNVIWADSHIVEPPDLYEKPDRAEISQPRAPHRDRFGVSWMVIEVPPDGAHGAAEK